jgi:hypothetical protein
MINKKTMKSIVFSFVLAAMTLTANNLSAQDKENRGMMGRGTSVENPQNGSKSLFQQNVNRDDPTSINGSINNESFGETAPLGSGIAILIGAGLGYVALKKKED